jgi:putative ABC transport system ATP-binding protein
MSYDKNVKENKDLRRELINLEAVTKTYSLGETTVDALRGLNLSVLSGEFIILLGPSGSGKTTTLDLIGGLDKPTSGHIIVDGEDITRYKGSRLTDYRRRKVGFIFQFFNLIPTLMAGENVELALAISKKTNLKEKAIEILGLVGLSNRADHFPSQLSGGEQQRVAAARAIANKPAILLCDEPTGNLDVDTGKQVLSAIKDLNRLEGTTIILVTHNTALAQMADRVVHLRNGTVDKIEINEQPVDVNRLDW